MARLYPATAEGMAALNAAIVEHNAKGNTSSFARSLGLSRGSVSNHRQRIVEALGKA